MAKKQPTKRKPAKPKVVRIKAWGIFKRGVEHPLDVQGDMFTKEAVEEFAKVRFPGWKRIEVLRITIEYTVSK